MHQNLKIRNVTAETRLKLCIPIMDASCMDIFATDFQQYLKSAT